MTLADLERGLRNELQTGRLGVPVALRIHATLPADAGDLWNVLGVFRAILHLMGNIAGGRVQGNAHSSGKQVCLLWTDDQGRTIFITLASSFESKPGLHLLLIGNHGIAQFDGGDCWNETIRPTEPLWSKEIRESLKTGTSIDVGSS